MSETEVMDNAVPISPNLFGEYTHHVRQLAIMPIGTRLATYWSNSEEVPRGYILQSSGFAGELKMWEKDILNWQLYLLLRMSLGRKSALKISFLLC